MSKAIYIGRFQFDHIGHISNVVKALAMPEIDELIILVGSANRCRSTKNPFSYDLRRKMLEAAISHMGLSPDKKVTIKPLNDHLIVKERWYSEVRELADGAKYIVGHDKDESSFYLKEFPEMEFIAFDPVTVGGKVLDASMIREDAYNGRWGSCKYVPMESMQVFKNWQMTPEGKEDWNCLLEEYQDELKEKELFSGYPFPTALNCCTADNVVVCRGHVLLITRKFTPGKGLLAIPGGHKDSNETFFECALRELKEETRLKVATKVLKGSLIDEKLFDDPNRSRNISKPTVAYYYEIEPDNDGKLPRVKARDDAKQAVWYPLNEVKARQRELFDDHFEIISYFTGI